MDERQSDEIDELQRWQSNITTLFQRINLEKKNYKCARDKSEALKETLLAELCDLRRENEQLRKHASKPTNHCKNCIELKNNFEELYAKKRKSEQLWASLREYIMNAPYENMSLISFCKLLKLQLDELEKQETQDPTTITDVLQCVDKHSLVNKKRIEVAGVDPAIKKLDIVTVDSFYGSSSAVEDSYQDKISSEPLIEDVCTDFSNDSNSFYSSIRTEILEREFFTPKKKVEKNQSKLVEGSPFSDGVNAGGYRVERSPTLPDQSLFLRGNPILQSPTLLSKRKPSFLKSRSPSGKSPKTKKYKSPFKSKPQLKTTNSIEAEISLAGVRKLKQTQLNLDYYKNKCQEQNENVEECKEEEKDASAANDESKFGEDDLILESPKRSPTLRIYLRKQRENDENGAKSNDFIDPDPDETYVSSSILNKMNRYQKDPYDRMEVSPDRERSPEFDSVHFPYRDKPIRKKAERMKLPGQSCMECCKYYKAVLGEIDPEKLQQILNKCSRHRDQHYNVVDTPQGYWNPYLTATIDTSAQEDETVG